MIRKTRPPLFPGLRVSLGITLTVLGFLVLIPLAALVLKSISGGWLHAWQTIIDPRLLASYRLSFGVAALAALFDGVIGGLAAWVITRYEFPGRRFLDALVDLPIALPTAVAGIALTALYAPNGWLGGPLLRWGIHAAYSPLGIFLALSFIGFPFVVRTLQPALQGLPKEYEEAAACLGAGRWSTIVRVVVPAVLPAWLTGIVLALGRGVGEYGSVVFIAGNLPFKTEIVPLLIVSKLEQYDDAGAAAVGTIMLFFSVIILAVFHRVSAWNRRRLGA
ncbi:MAG: sulfate ABC transporter permease subunit CysT [Spirochaetes bacterium]|nr:sulfate ABC transporter permease subunit CysT [Spirochaetota bacterium]